MTRRTLAALCVVLAGCAPAGNQTVSTRPPSLSQVQGGWDVRVDNSMAVSADRVEAPVDRVWAVLPAVYQSAGIEVASVDPETHTLGNLRVRLPRQMGDERLGHYLDCGTTHMGTPVSEAYRVEADIRTTVVPVEGGSELRTGIAAFAKNPTGTSEGTYTCSSTGRLEALIAETVRGMLAG